MKLNEVCELIVDCPHTTAQDEGSGYALIRTPNIGAGYFNLDGVHRVSKSVYDARNMRAVPQPNDLILAREAPVGNVAIIPEGEQYCLGQRTVLIRPDDKKVNPYFLNYYLNSPKIRYDLTSGANGATVAHLNMPKIRGLEIELPSRTIQDRIATILSNYDMLIANCRKQIALLEEAAQRLYREWFVNFRFPGHVSTPIIDGLPQGWVYGVVENLGKFIRGKNLLTTDAIPGNVPVIAGGLTPSCWHNISNTSYPVITVSGSVANAGYTAIHNIPVWAADCSFLDTSQSDFLHYIYCFLKENSSLLKSKQKGSAQPHVYAKDINSCVLVIPGNSILSKFENTVCKYFEEIGQFKSLITQLKDARETLLPRMMSGEVDVSEISEPVTNCEQSQIATSFENEL